MRLQELKTKEAKQWGEATVKTVRLFFQNTFYSLNGSWHWEMETDAVFCSDVMVQSPDNFFGTKAIFHPDDLPAVKERLSTDEPVDYLGFRIITTYGEVKQVRGEAITVQVEEQTAEDLQKQAIEAVIAEQERKAAAKHDELVKELADKNSRFAGLGNWYFNAATGQTWYSNAVFTLHGLPPQSLNAHLHTFHPFIHPDDVVLVTDFQDKAFRERSSLQMDYRILAGETEKWISYKCDWFFNAGGEAILGGTYQDISDQKATELALEGFKNLVQLQRQQIQYDEQQVNFGHWQVNLLTRKTVYSDQYYRIFGLKPQSLAATLSTFLNYIHPEDRVEVEAAYKKMIYEHAAPELEYRVVRLDGKMRYIQQKAKLLLYEGDLIISGLIQDVTVQRMLEKKLARVQEENWVQGQVAEQASEMASLLSWSVDLEDGSITWSDSFYRFLGFSKTAPPNVSEKSLYSIIHPQDVKLFKEHWTRAVRDKQPATFEFRSMQRGSIYHMTAVFSLQERAEKTWFIGTVEDITGEQVLQQKLAQRVQLAESLTHNIPDRVIITDTNNTVLVWNPAAEKAYGVKKNDAIGENFFDLFPALKTEEEMQLFHRVHRGEKVVVENAASVTGNGFYNLHLLPLFSGDEVSGILHIVRNVTAETELRQHLNDRLHLIESLVQSSVDRIIALDSKMNYLFWNKKAEEYYGLTKEEVLGKNILEVFPQMVNDPSYQQLRKALKGETIHIPIDPSRQKYFETYLIPIKGQDGSVVSLLWTAHDLSHEWQLQEEQRKSQARLQEEHRRLKEAQAIGHVGSFEWKVGSSIAYWSDELYRINGLEPQSEEITLDKVDQFIHPDDFAELQKVKDSSFANPGDYKMVHRIVRRAGDVRWVAHEWQSVANENGGVSKITGIVQDITEQVQAEERLHKNEALLRSTEEVAHIGSYEADLLQNTFRFSEGMYRLFGEEPHSFEPSLDWIDSRSFADDVAPVKEILDRAIATGQPYTYLRRIYRRDGELRTLEAHGKVIADAKGQPVKLIGLVQDITERQKAEEDLKESRLFIEQVVDATPGFIMVFNLVTNKLDYVNRSGYRDDESRYHETLRIEYDQILSRAHPDDRQSLHQFIEWFRTAKDNEIHSLDYRVIKGKEVIWNRSRGKVFKRDEQNRPTHYISIIQDISREKEAAAEILRLKDAIAQKATDKYLTLFNSIDEAVVWCEIITDNAGKAIDYRLLELNSAYEKMTGLTVEASKGKTAKELVPTLEQWWVDTYARMMADEKPVRFEHRMASLGRWFNVYASPVGDPKDGQFVLVYTDITERKQQEERQAYLLKVSDATRSLSHPDEILNEALKTVAEYLDLDRIGYNEIDPDVTEYWYRACYAREGFAPVLGRFQMDPFKETVENLQKGITFIANNAFAESFSEAEKEVHRIINVGAYVTVPLIKGGRWVCNLVAQYSKPRVWTEREIAILEETAERIWAAVERARAEEAVAADFRDTQILQKLSEHLVSEDNINVIYQQVMDAAITLTNAAAGMVQILDEKRQELVLLTTAGFPKYVTDYFARVDAGSNTSCGRALTNRQRTFVDFDVPEEQDPDGSLRLHVKAGYFSAQSTPLVSRSGKTIGMVSTHWRQQGHRPTERELRFLDLLARQAADLIEQRQAEKALRQSEEEFRLLVTATSNSVYKMSADWKLMYNLQGKDFLSHTSNTEHSWMEKYIPVHERQRIRAAIETAIRTKTNFDLEHQVHDAAGNIAWVHSRAIPKLDEKGEVIEWIGAGINITLRKEAEEQLKEFALMLEQQVEERTENLKRSTDELQKNIAILQQAEELSQMGSWEYIIKTGEFYWSQGMYDLFGLPAGLLVKPETYLEFARDEDKAVAKTIIKNLKRTHQPFEETMQIKRGTALRLIKIKASVVTDDAGKAQKMVGVDLDITDIREAEIKIAETQRLLEQTAQASPDAITIYDVQNKQPVYLNNCLAEWVGRTNEELIHMGIDGRLKLIHPDDRLPLLHFNEKIKAAKDGALLTIEYRVYGKEDKILWLRNRSKVFQRNAAGHVTYILSVLQDITESKASERVQKALTTSLEKKAQELESANEEITSFAFVASHDLKEPLRKIRTFSNLLLTQERALSETGRTNLEKLDSSVDRLNLLISDVLTLTKLHVENEQPAPTGLNQLLDKLRKEMGEAWAGASIETGPLPTVLGRENQLFYLFKNLISNGVKFQEKGSVPTIRIEAVKEDGYHKISVRDNGIGIHPDYHKKIFEIFRRLHNRTEYEGTGMGLAICKKIMEKHSGKITVDSTVGKGTAFTCWFPVALSTS
jgi:PAS domain S-box-containing protein